MSDTIRASLVLGQVVDGEREGQTWIGIEGDDAAYERLEGPLSGKVTHALVIGDRDVVRRLRDLLSDHLDDPVSDD